ncbi:MAG: response regulator transcription factor [Bacteroidota bacterium]
MSITVSIVDDNTQLRKSLAQILNLSNMLECTSTYSSVGEALRGVDANPPDVLLMDIEMPGMSGIQGTELIKRAHPSIDVIMLTSYSDSERIIQSIVAGASGYLLKKTEPQHLIDAIVDIARGGSVMTSSVARTLLEKIRAPKPTVFDQPASALTDRERMVLEHLMVGKSYKDIAADMYISIDTVRSYIRSIYEKLQVHTKSAAVAEAMKRGLV